MQDGKKVNNDEKKLNSTEHTLFKKKIPALEKQEKMVYIRKNLSIQDIDFL